LQTDLSTISKPAKNIQNLTAFFDSKATNLEVSKKSISSHRGCRPATSQVLQIVFKCFNKSAPVTPDMIEMLQPCFKKMQLLQIFFKSTAINYMIKYARLTHNSFKTEPNQSCKPSNGIKELLICYKCFKQ